MASRERRTHPFRVWLRGFEKSPDDVGFIARLLAVDRCVPDGGRDALVRHRRERHRDTDAQLRMLERVYETWLRGSVSEY